MSDELVHYSLERGVATVTLDSSANRNALSKALVEQLRACLLTAASDESVRAVVLTHTGSVFCAGADLKEQSSEGGPQRGTTRMRDLMRTILELPKPVLARVDGAVRAGGIGVLAACDIAVAGRRTSFAFTEARIGVAPAVISLTTLGRMTERAASRYFLTGEKFDADAAAACGLVTLVADDVDAAVDALAAELRLCSPQGLAETKPLTTSGALAAFDARGDEMQALSARLFASDEAAEGMRAFLEKRPPRWALE